MPNPKNTKICVGPKLRLKLILNLFYKDLLEIQSYEVRIEYYLLSNPDFQSSRRKQPDTEMPEEMRLSGVNFSCQLVLWGYSNNR